MSIYEIKPTSAERLIYRMKALETGNLRLRRGNYGPITGPFSRSRNESLDPFGNVDPSSKGFLKRGAVTPTANTNGFAYTSTASSIHWYWDATNGSTIIQIRRSDKSQVVVKPGNIEITGLAAATTYYFFPFWVANDKYDVGWVVGKHGDPQIAFVITDLDGPDEGPAAAAKQILGSREPLTNGAMSAVTPAAGTGGAVPGSGGNPTGGGACVIKGTELKALGDIDLVTEEFPETDWIYIRLIDGRELTCTEDHPLYNAVDGKLPASFLSEGDLLITDSGEVRIAETKKVRKPGIKVKVLMMIGHLYFAGGFLSHNVKGYRGIA